MTPEAVLEVARAGQRLGCTEALFTLGERPEQRYPEAREWLERRGFHTTLQYLAHVCQTVAEETSLNEPHVIFNFRLDILFAGSKAVMSCLSSGSLAKS